MKGIEEIIKESVQNYEVPYDASAWDSLSAKLDANTKVAPKKWPWILGIAGAAAIITTIVLVQNQDENTPTIAQTQETEQTIVTPNNKVEQNKVQTIEENKSTPEEVIADDNNVSPNNNSNNTVVYNDNNTVKSDDKHSDTTVKNDSDTGNSSVEDPKIPQNTVRKFVSGDISKNTICKGEVVTISNNKRGHVLFALDNDVYHLINGESKQFKLAQSSEIKFVNDKGETLSNEYITVNEAPTVQFSYENYYEEGVPVTKIQSYSPVNDVTYTVGDKVFEGKEVTINIFDKSNHKVTMTGTDNNGCESSATQNIQLEKDYNLLAMNAFNPNSTIPENRTFMPYALKERTETQFVLTIFDSRDNQIVFQSTNALDSWDGTDRRTGRLVDANISYVWQVKLQNPLPGENNAYAGTVNLQSNF